MANPNFIRLTIMLLQQLKFGLIAENSPLSCARGCRREGEGGSRELSVSGCCLCALSGWSGVARCSGQEPRQPSSKVNSTASLSSPGLCLFCPLQAPPEACDSQQHEAVLAPCKQPGSSCSVCASAAAALPLLPWALLAAQSPCFQLKSHGCACSLPRHAAAGSCGAETWKIASRDVAFLFWAPRSFTEIRCVLCVRKK